MVSFKKSWICTLEIERVRLQQEIDSRKCLQERNFLGQYSTPPELALEIVRFVLKLRESLGIDKAIRFLEPAVGTGSFYSALLRNTPIDSVEAATGIEADSEFSIVANQLWSNLKMNVLQADFTATESGELGVYNLLITNPPYVRHHHLDRNSKQELRTRVSNELGYKVSGLSGLYVYFMLLSHKWLEKDGLSAWVIPSEFMDVNYASVLRQYLTEKVTLKFIHRYDVNTRQFSDALVSSSVVVFQNRPSTSSDMAMLTVGDDISNPLTSREVKLTDLRQPRKWTSHFRLTSSNQTAVKLSDFFDIKRGIATGNNSFFIMSRDEARSRGIPDECVRPILPPPRSLKCDIVPSAVDGYADLNEQLVVIDSAMSEIEIEKRYPEFWGYLKQGKQEGVADTYLCRNRKVWYKQEIRKPAPFLCTYMGRGGKNNSNPFRFIMNKSEATATNVYLMLYPKGQMRRLLGENPDMQSEIFYALQRIGIDEFSKEGREYGGGLKKVEPKELGNVSVGVLIELIEGLQESPSLQK